MFRKKKALVVLRANQEDVVPGAPQDTVSFEQKVDIVLHKLEKVGVKVFAGVCIYIVLDTMRQVAVAQAVLETSE